MAPLKKGDLTDEETELLQVISEGNIQEAGRLLGSKNVRVNCLDQHGMTPLMHAAYKGKAEMCKLLLQHGADVNCNEHEHGYTALMFAGLSGNKEITRMMLEAGAEIDVVNSVGRTAAQMAAFVGQHDCVTIINNFFSRESLDFYTKQQGLDKEPKLPVKLAGPLHKIIIMTNLHPVAIVLMVKENPLLADVEALSKCYRVLDLIIEKCMKQREINEVLAMKMHYLSYVFQKCITFLKEHESKLDGLIKSLLKGRDSDGFPTYQEKFIRECIRKFPWCEATLLQQLVRTIAPVEIGNDPTALSVMTQIITGQVGFVDAEFCTACGEKGADKRCSICKTVRTFGLSHNNYLVQELSRETKIWSYVTILVMCKLLISFLNNCSTKYLNSIQAVFPRVYNFLGAYFLKVIYCNQNCQKMHWFTHKKVCKKLKETREKQEAKEKLKQNETKATTSETTRAEATGSSNPPLSTSDDGSGSKDLSTGAKAELKTSQEETTTEGETISPTNVHTAEE